MDEAFFRRVEHDLRGELATMMAGLHYVLRYEKPLSSTARDMLERVHGAGERLKRLLDEFGDAAWIASDQRITEMAPYDLSAVVDGAVARLERAATLRNVTIEKVPGEVEGSPMGDPDLLTSAIEYAVDFAVARSPNATVSVRWDAPAGGPAVVTIVDRGGAVEPMQVEHLVEPFVEQDVVAKPPPGTRKRERLGLGLAIAGGILEAHGGALDVALAEDGSGIVLRCVLGATAEPTTATAKRSA